MVERIKTFVNGLDESLDGGIPVGSVVLLVGKPGTMKSSLAYYILYYNALNAKIKGLYVALEQSRESLLANVSGMGMNPDYVGTDIGFIDLGMIRKQSSSKTVKLSMIEFLRSCIRDLTKSRDYKLLVIDSLPVLKIIANFKEPREDLFQFFEWLRSLKLTSIIISEMEQDTQKFAEHGEEFLADGIIHLDMHRDQNIVNLFLGVVKMRMTNIKRGYYPLIFDEKGFEIVAD
jgi:KaiC/GvpD/RAD55 family RecA-like ATPase